MTEIHELRLPYAGISRIEITCPNCKAQTTIDLLKSDQIERFAIPEEEGSSDFRCSFCNKLFPSAIRLAVYPLWKAFEKLKDSKQTISFCVSGTSKSKSE